MIYQAFDHIVDELNSYFSIKISEPDRVVANSLINQDGSLQNNIDGKVVVTLVNTEEERIVRDPDVYQKQPDGSLEIKRPEIKLNLLVLFSANIPADYNEALKMISLVIGFFRKKNKFNPSNSPGLNPLLKDLSMEMVSLNMEQQNHMWASLGAKYIPSALYKMRLVTITDEEIKGIVKPITQIYINENP